MKKTPPDGISIPIVNSLIHFYKNLYLLGKKISKRDRLGIHAKIENLCLESLRLSIKIAFSPRHDKQSDLSQLRIYTEILKRLVRLSYEIQVYNITQYAFLEKELQEISKMATGWLKYVIKKESR